MGRIVSLAQAVHIRSRLRERGKTVVLTNGVFDILHVGHVRYLQAARKLGDMLFVGLNSDASAQALKGAGRPLTPQSERAEILSAMRYVDYVILFDEPTATHLVEALQPDVYAKGGDYGVGKPLPEARAVENWGGRIVLLPYTPRHSTTHIVARILGSE